jgi:hypothetical protein
VLGRFLDGILLVELMKRQEKGEEWLMPDREDL